MRIKELPLKITACQLRDIEPSLVHGTHELCMHHLRTKATDLVSCYLEIGAEGGGELLVRPKASHLFPCRLRCLPCLFLRREADAVELADSGEELPSLGAVVCNLQR